MGLSSKIKSDHERVVDYQKTFNSPSGRKVLRDLMRSNWVLTPHASEKIEPHEICFREGQRSAILRIMTFMDIDPNKFINLATKATEETDDYDPLAAP